MLPMPEARSYVSLQREANIAIRTAFENSENTVNKSSARIGRPMTMLRGKNVVPSNLFHDA